MTSRHLYAPLAPAALTIALLAARIWRTGSPTYQFLSWNLVLAAIPYGLSLGATKLSEDGRPRAAAALGAMWLLFFPNAPYLVTDLYHLRERLPVPLWFDIALLSSAALAGIALGLASLARIHALVERHYGHLRGWATVVFASTLAGFGIWLGRFGRWNSWDVVVRPGDLFAHSLLVLTRPLDNPRALGVTAVFSAIIVAAYVTIAPARQHLERH